MAMAMRGVAELLQLYHQCPSRKSNTRAHASQCSKSLKHPSISFRSTNSALRLSSFVRSSRGSDRIAFMKSVLIDSFEIDLYLDYYTNATDDVNENRNNLHALKLI